MACTRHGGSFDLDTKRTQAADLQQQAADPSLWDDPAKGRRVTSELARLNAELDRVDGLQRKLGDARALDELLIGAEDPDLERELATSVDELERALDALRLEALLGGSYDGHDAIATVQAGAGGTESQDWAEMLLRMFSRWAERLSFDVDVDEVHYGEEAGIKSATFTVRGHNAYGLLSAERGVHRLVRISPFDAQKRRHTSFASLDVIPALDEEEAEEGAVDEADLRIDVSRSSGPGGQGVNTTDSAVRITHLPTGIVVSCQNERSQLQNKESALRILRARLLVAARESAAADTNAARASQVRTVDRSERVRTYNFRENRISDHRVGYTAYNLDRVLDGELDGVLDVLTKADTEQRLAGE